MLHDMDGTIHQLLHCCSCLGQHTVNRHGRCTSRTQLTVRDHVSKSASNDRGAALSLHSCCLTFNVDTIDCKLSEQPVRDLYVRRATKKQTAHRPLSLPVVRINVCSRSAVSFSEAFFLFLPFLHEHRQ